LGFGEDAERSIEIDPRTVDEDYLHGLVDLGFNRISMGVQDLDPDVMRAVNRPQSVTTIEAVVRAVRSRGSIPLTMDLIYGLPEQTVSTWRSTLERIVGLRPDRLAVYGYAHVPWMKRYHATLDRYERPDDSLRATLALMARETLEMAGYRRIGFDHFALPDDELSLAVEAGTLHRNFMGYTTRRGLDLVAMGVSGISAVNGTYTQNLKDVESWAGAIEQGSTPWLRGLLLSVDDELRREIILDLTCNFFLPFEPLERAFGIDARTALAPEIGRLQDMERDGLLEIGEIGIRVTDLGKPFIRNICMVFDTYLGANDSQRFSRTS
ncbi:MAG: oxygen-independent coproporphyrinogen III oxidase, partial [Myxococcota bacterium]|nr:oxygen-independent coproporphyrinogen III oxidase [Myxococcota bacterium]